MSWSLISVTNGTNDGTTAVTAVLPATYATGDLLLLFIIKRGTSQTITVAPDQSYVLLGEDNAGSETGGIWLYGKIATSGSETAPSYTFSGTAPATNLMASFRDSNGATAIGSIVHALAKGDTATNSNATVTYPALTVTQDNCLVITAGWKQKSIDEATESGDPSGFTIIQDFRRPASSATAAAWHYQIQTTAASITSSTYSLSPWTEGTQNERALTIALLATAGAAPLAPIRLIWRV